MNERKSKVPGVADYIVSHRGRRKETFLDEIDRLIDWKPIEKLLQNKLPSGQRAMPDMPDTCLHSTRKTSKISCHRGAVHTWSKVGGIFNDFWT